MGRLFPSYGIANVDDTFKTTRKRNDVPQEQLYNEVQNSDKLFHKQKYFLKDFMEELLRSNVNPNKR